MCDYSLQHAKTRSANVADKLQSHPFGRGTTGFKAVNDEGTGENATAVCLLPGTELAFEDGIKVKHTWEAPEHVLEDKVAIFRQKDKDNLFTHHDCIETPDGIVIAINQLVEGQFATVLQLPAAPKTADEAKEQTRLEVVG